MCSFLFLTIAVYSSGTSSTHALTVGAGGILAFEQTGKDAFNGIGAGIAKQTKEEINGENITIKEIAPENFVLLADGSRFLHTATGIRIGSELKASMELQLLLKWGLILRALQR